MRVVHTVLIAAALALSSPAFAQQAQIETQMSAADLQATGLGTLSAAELARLNDWLAQRANVSGAAASTPASTPAAGSAGDIDARLAQAREEGRREAADDSRGVAVAQSREPIDTTLPGKFEGFTQGRQYTLANGQVWRQTNAARIAGPRGSDIAVRIRPGFMDAWWMKVDGYNTEARVERVK